MSFIKTNLNAVSRFFGENQLDLFPLRKFLKSYRLNDAQHDVRAGLNVALLAFPQGMAYASIAGLPIQYGIYGSALAAIFSAFHSGSRFIAQGPTNATSVILFASFMTLGVTQADKEAMLPLLLTMTGAFLVLGSFLKVASMTQFISRSVATGYISAAAIYIIVNQLRKIIGVEFDIPEGSTFIDVVRLTVVNAHSMHIPSLILAAITALLFVFLNYWNKRLPNVAITLLIMSFAATMMNNAGWFDSIGGKFATLTEISAADWSLSIPTFNDEWFSVLTPIALVIAFLAILEGTSIGKSLAARSGERIDANQEMLSMGMANMACAFFGGMTSSGSLTRSQLNWSSGAKTPISHLFCGIICIIGIFALGPYIKYIPIPCLGILVISIGLSLINKHIIGIILKSTRGDAAVFIVTFVASMLVRLDYAIFIGASLSIILFLKKAASPELVEYSFTEEGHLAQLEEKRPDPEVSIVHVEGDLFFAASDMFRDQMRRICHDPNLKVVILKMRNAFHIDATCVLALEELVTSMNQNDSYLILSEVRPHIKEVLTNSGMLNFIGEENIFDDISHNTTMSTAKAVKRAKQILGGKDTKISIYVNPAKKDPSKS